MAWNSDSVCRNDNGSCICIFIEERNQYLRTENIVRFCSRGYGGGIGVVASDSVHGDVRKSRKAGIYTRSSRVHGRYFFLLFLDHVIPHLHVSESKPEGLKTSLKESSMLVLAVTLHNIPEGMAVGAVFAGMAADNETITLMGALALAIGIAIQNIPEGAIISMPVCSAGNSKNKAFLYGILSGVVEPVGALLTIWLAEFILPFLPYLLAFAAGAMIYVVVEELIPETSRGEHSNVGTISFAVGFVLMMMLDVALG